MALPEWTDAFRGIDVDMERLEQIRKESRASRQAGPRPQITMVSPAEFRHWQDLGYIDENGAVQPPEMWRFK